MTLLRRAPRRRKEYEEEEELYEIVDDDEDEELEIGEKCGPDMEYAAPYRPFNGATTFAEVEAYDEAQKIQWHSQDQMRRLEAVMNNILSDQEIEQAQKAALIKKAAQDFEKMLQKPPAYKAFLSRVFGRGESDDEDGELEVVEKAKRNNRIGARTTRVSSLNRANSGSYSVGTVKVPGSKPRQTRINMSGKPDNDSIFSYGKTNRPGTSITFGRSNSRRISAARVPKTKRKEFGEATVGEFRVFKSRDTGEDRWVIVGSNNFQDRDGEIITREAHKNFVSYVDRTGNYPELRIWHEDKARIGISDVVDEHEGFIIASGTFDNEEVGERLATLSKERDLAVSMGFEYLPSDRKDGVFDWYRGFEFSVLPRENASNQITLFLSGTKEKGLNTKRKSFMEEVLGPEFVQTLESSVTKMASKARAAGIAYKANDDDDDIDDEDDDLLDDDIEDDEDDEFDFSIDVDDTVEVDGKQYVAVAEKAEQKFDPSRPGKVIMYTNSGGKKRGRSITMVNNTKTGRLTSKYDTKRRSQFKESAGIAEALEPVLVAIKSLADHVERQQNAITALSQNETDKVADLLRPRNVVAIKRKSADEQDGDDEEHELVAAAKKSKKDDANVPEHLQPYTAMGLGAFLNTGVK